MSTRPDRCIFDALVPKGKKKCCADSDGEDAEEEDRLPNTQLDECAIDENCLNSPSEAHSQHLTMTLLPAAAALVAAWVTDNSILPHTLTTLSLRLDRLDFVHLPTRHG